MQGGPYPEIPGLEITCNGVEKLLRKLVPTKAPGPDCIPNVLLKELAIELLPVLTALFNQSIQTGEHPKDWKRANISQILLRAYGSQLQAGFPNMYMLQVIRALCHLPSDEPYG